MNTAIPFPAPEQERGEANAAKWPVLARLPDVSSSLPLKGAQSHRARSGEVIDYRFDPAETSGSESGSVATRQAMRAARSENAGITHGSRPPQPHLFHRTSRADERASAVRGTSPILPRSNLFSTGDGSLHDTIGPAVRFFMLVALFTVAGTTVLMIGSEEQASPEISKPVPPALRQTLEPTTAADASNLSVEGPAAAPTASGPLGAQVGPHVDAIQTPIVLPADPITPLTSQDVDAETHGEGEPAGEPLDDREREARESPLLPLTSADGRPLPQVQTSEPPAAVAHLPGHILEVPSRQANHDDNQPSIY